MPVGSRMWMRMAPPGLASSSQTGLVKWCGPHHTATHFGSVQALNTSFLGASNTRVSTNSCSLLAIMFPVAMLVPLLLHVAQIIVEAIEALHPKLPVVRHPISDVFQGRGGDPARPPLRLASARNQAGMFQHLQVPGHSGHAHREGSRQLGDGRLASGKPGKDGAPGGVGQSGEGSAEVVRHEVY